MRSMTGFAAGRGSLDDFDWAWDVRSVNGRGLDLRFRMPDWLTGLEGTLRKAVTAEVARGNVTVSLRLTRTTGANTLAVDRGAVDRALDALHAVEERAMERGMTLAPSCAADVLAQRGVMDGTREEADPGPLVAALTRDFAPVLAAFQSSRAAEGAALQTVLTDRVDQVASLTEAAAAQAEARRPQVAEALRAGMARVLEEVTVADPQRLAQELAIIAVKSDVAEELDRLRAHVGAARDLLAAEGPVGRKLDFLTQEFNREANTLCAKSQDTELTRIGLDLKAVIDQVREQVQNVE